jgi:hypothetical protein
MNQLMFPFNDKDKVFLYKLNEIVDKIPAYKNKQRSNIPEKCEMATTFQTFLNKFDAFDYNIRRFIPFL